MMLIQLSVLFLVAISGTAVVFARDPSSQPIGISFFGLLLAIMFMAFQAPDVALSQIVIGTVGLPLMILLALAKMRRDAELRENNEKRSQAGGSLP
jgi:energy-converting hydrogenase B subunit D